MCDFCQIKKKKKEHALVFGMNVASPSLLFEEQHYWPIRLSVSFKSQICRICDVCACTVYADDFIDTCGRVPQDILL